MTREIAASLIATLLTDFMARNTQQKLTLDVYQIRIKYVSNTYQIRIKYVYCVGTGSTAIIMKILE